MDFSLESNRNAPISYRSVFEQTLYLQGDEIARELSGDRASLPGTVRGFCAAMDKHGEWQPVSIVLAEAPPGGPGDHDSFPTKLGANARRFAGSY